MSKRLKVLLYGYGNPGRQDDGLGIACVDHMERWINKKHLSDHVATDCNYQLNIEDVEAIADKDVVIFIDASKENIKDLMLKPLKASDDMSFSMHSVAPGYLLHLCQALYQYQPRAFLLHIKGYEWEINEPMTSNAEKNLDKAVEKLKQVILSSGEFVDDLEEEMSEIINEKINNEE